MFYFLNSYPMKDVVFFFGAGASFGAGDILPEVPPLGNQLYDRLSSLYPGTWGAVPNTVKDTFRGNFEHGMEAVYNLHTNAVPVLMQDMASFFVQFRAHSNSSLYCELSRRLRELKMIERVLFSSLNYDIILEMSLLKQNYKLNYFEWPCSPEQIPVLKLHGSCNFFAHEIGISRDISFGSGVAFEGGIEASLDTNWVLEKIFSDSGLPPVMNLYMRGKPLQVSPSVISKLQDNWVAAVNSANAIFCIGVNPNMEDKHIWEPLSKSRADLLFVGDERSFHDWAKLNRVDTSSYLGNYFSNSFEIIIERAKKYAFE